MKLDKKFLAAVICCGVLALAVVVQGTAFHQARAEDAAALAQAGERISALEGELAQAEEEQQALEERLAGKDWLIADAARRNNPIDQYYYSENRPYAITTLEMSVEESLVLGG